MRVFRAHSRVVTSVAVVWQLMAIMFVPVAVYCRHSGPAGPDTSAATMANCPMHPQEPSAEPTCPLHVAKPSHECDCPTMECSQTGDEFMTLFGPVGVLPAPSLGAALDLAGLAVPVGVPSDFNPAFVPLAPPPRV